MDSKLEVYIADRQGMVDLAIVRTLQQHGHNNLVIS